MTIEEYNTATDIIKKIQTLDNEIYDIKNIIRDSDAANWNMEIRPNNSHPLININHKGLLPEFLNMVLSELCKERAELARTLEKL